MKAIRKLLDIKFFYVIYTLIKRYFSDAVSKSAAALSYFMFFSLFPAAIFLNSIISRIQLSSEITDFLERVIPADIIEILEDYLTYSAEYDNSTPYIFGILLTIYFLSRSINSLLRTINAIYDIDDKERSGIIRLGISLVFTIGFMLSFILVLVLLVLGNVILEFVARFFPFVWQFMPLFDIIRFFVPVVWIGIYLMMLYYVVPNRRVSMKACLPGTAFALIGWVISSVIFSFYVNNMADYSIIYGSIGAIMVMLLWLYVTGVVIILGAELNYILQEYNKY